MIGRFISPPSYDSYDIPKNIHTWNYHRPRVVADPSVFKTSFDTPTAPTMGVSKNEVYRTGVPPIYAEWGKFGFSIIRLVFFHVLFNSFRPKPPDAMLRWHPRQACLCPCGPLKWGQGWLVGLRAWACTLLTMHGMWVPNCIDLCKGYVRPKIQGISYPHNNMALQWYSIVQYPIFRILEFHGIPIKEGESPRRIGNAIVG